LSLAGKVFVFVGPPGSGKGSISSLCIKNLGWVQLSTGNLCRKHIANQTETGKEIDFAIKSGKLVSDSLITNMVLEWFQKDFDESHTVILDGYPRTIMQAQAFAELFEERLFKSNLHVVRFVLSDEMIMARLSNRLVCENKDCQAVYSEKQETDLSPRYVMKCDFCDGRIGRREDDDKDAVAERLRVYHRHEQDLLDFYQKAGQVVHNVSVEKPLKEVFDDFKALVGLE
jgi:adenylate kinase